MKVSELLERYKRQAQDTIDVDLMLEWVEAVERQIFSEIILTHEGYERFASEGMADLEKDYFEDFGLDKDILADMPYYDLYIYYIDLKFYQLNKETDNFNVAVIAFNNAYNTFRNYYNRKHKPISKTAKVFNHLSL